MAIATEQKMLARVVEAEVDRRADAARTVASAEDVCRPVRAQERQHHDDGGAPPPRVAVHSSGPTCEQAPLRVRPVLPNRR
jgi:hypothetical protein